MVEASRTGSWASQEGFEVELAPMRMNPRRIPGLIVPSIFVAISICAAAARVSLQSQQPQTGEEKSPQPPAADRLRIVVTGGEKNQPIEGASVYISYYQEHKLKKDKRIEINVKTNQDGVARVPYPPKRRVWIAVVPPEGWKTFGQYYDIEDLSQPIQIHLEKPHRWY